MQYNLWNKNLRINLIPKGLYEQERVGKIDIKLQLIINKVTYIVYKILSKLKTSFYFKIIF